MSGSLRGASICRRWCLLTPPLATIDNGSREWYGRFTLRHPDTQIGIRSRWSLGLLIAGVAGLLLAPSGFALTLTGGPGNDNIDGTSSTDYIYGYGGDDDLDGRGGADVLFGGDGRDLGWGGTGNDYVYGQNGGDHSIGAGGADHVYSGCNPGCNTGNDFIEGRDGNDVMGAENGKYDSIDGDSGLGNVGTGDNCYVDQGLDYYIHCEFIH